MMILNSPKYALGIAASIALLTGCGSGAGSQLAPSGLQPNTMISGLGNQNVNQTGMLIARSGVIAKVHKNDFRGIPLKPNWKPNCCAKLGFVSDAGEFPGAVHVYSFPKGKYITDLAQPPEGFQIPQGLCVATNGDIFVSNAGKSTIDRYSHSGTFVQALSDSGQKPAGCSYDKTTGNLAVANFCGPGNQGNVAIYAGATGSPTLYTDPSNTLYCVDDLGYNNKGVLWISGTNLSAAFTLAKFSGGTFTAVPVTGGSGPCGGPCSPGTVQWSGKMKMMALGDQDANKNDSPSFYYIKPTGKVMASTSISPTCDVAQAWFSGGLVLAPDNCEGSSSIWNVPGGSLHGTLSFYGYTPIGSTVSP